MAKLVISIRASLTLVVLVGLSAPLLGCSSGKSKSNEESTSSTVERLSFEQVTRNERAAAIYSAVIRKLVVEDNTGLGPFDRVFVDETLWNQGRTGRRLVSAVKRRIADRLGDLPPLDFVRNSRAVLADRKGCAHVKGNGVLITVSPISRGPSNKVNVRGTLFVACLGAGGATYALKPDATGWHIVGTTGQFIA